MDEVLAITDGDAIRAAKELGRTEGLLVGFPLEPRAMPLPSLPKRPENAGKLIVAIFPDTM